MNLFCVGLSHHSATVETRERFAGHGLSERTLRDAGCEEALILSTCNRVEVYGASAGRISTDEIARCLVRLDPSSPQPVETQSHHEFAPLFYRYDGEKCVQHLFRVTSGLDSMVVGETEILGQAKKAYEVARESGSVGAYLHRLFQRAFRVAKQVRTHTDINRGLVSVGSVAVDLAQKIFGDLQRCSALVLGAGEMSERTVRALFSRGVADLTVSNRSIDRAEELAKEVNGRAVPFAQWAVECRRIDILVASTSSEVPLVTRDVLKSILDTRIDRPLFIIDMAVPRDVDPSVNELEGVYLYDMDSLQSVAEQSIALRRQQIVAAEAIIDEHVASFEETVARGLEWRARNMTHSPIAKSSLRASES